MDDELVSAFLHESEEIVIELHAILKNYLIIPKEQHFEEYGQKIDRIMGSAFTLSFHELGELSRMGKELSYKSISVNEKDKLIVIHGLLSQILKMISQGLALIRKGKQLNQEEVGSLMHKLQIASSKIGDVKSSVET